MDNNTITLIKDAITKAQNIGITAPRNSTMDEMAAALSLYLILKSANKNVSIASPTDPIVEIATLVGIDKVEKTLKGSGGGSGDLTVSFPYTEGEIEKVSYTLEEGYLNIIVKAGEQGLSFDERDVEFLRGAGGDLDLVFAVGTPRIFDLNSVFDTQNPDIRIINIDNKPDNEHYGDIVLVSPKLSSISEGVADLALAMGMQIDQDAAQNLLDGISSATENFQSSKTSPLAFEIVGLLMKKGATREFSQAARRGISGADRQPIQTQSNLQPQTQRLPDQRRVQDRQNNIQDKRDVDRSRFEENLQKRVAEERAREEGSRSQQNRPGTQARSSMRQSQQKPDEYQDDVQSDDQAPDDWLAPKVYKGSSEV